MLSRWTHEGQETDIPRIYYLDAPGNSRFSDRWIEDGSYLRLKNVELSYTFKNNWLKKMGINSCRLYLNGDNLYMWTDMPDDREANYGTGSSDGAYPTVRRFNFGIDITL